MSVLLPDPLDPTSAVVDPAGALNEPGDDQHRAALREPAHERGDREDRQAPEEHGGGGKDDPAELVERDQVEGVRGFLAEVVVDDLPFAWLQDALAVQEGAGWDCC